MKIGISLSQSCSDGKEMLFLPFHLCFFDVLVVVAVVMTTKTFQRRVKCAMANCGVWEDISMNAG